MTYLTPSLLSSLTELSLSLWSEPQGPEDIAFQHMPHELQFLCLKRLALYFEAPEHIWRIVKCICAPGLTHLIASTGGMAIQESIPDEPPEPKFPYLKKLDIVSMTPSWASVFIRTIPASNNELSTLCLSLLEEPQAGDTVLQRKYFPYPMELNCLRNLNVSLSFRHTWFFNAFKLFAVSEHIELDHFCLENDGEYLRTPVATLSEHPLLFTNVKKLTVPSRKHLTCFAAPYLRHLILDYRGYTLYTDLVHLDRKQVSQMELAPLLSMGCHLSASNLEVLELHVVGRTAFAHQVLAPFCKLHTLVIHVGACIHFGEDLLTFSFGKPGDSISESCLPKLQSLGLEFELPYLYLPRNVDPKESRYPDALLMARTFIEKRQEHGLSIKTLRLIGYIPTGLLSDPNFEWFQNCSGVNLEFEKTPHDPFAYGFTSVR